MTDLQVDLQQMEQASVAWGEAGDALSDSATSAQGIQSSHPEITWGMYDDYWKTVKDAAAFMHDRLTEAANESHSIRDVLAHIARVYGAQDADFAAAIAALNGGS